MAGARRGALMGFGFAEISRAKDRGGKGRGRQLRDWTGRRRGGVKNALPASLGCCCLSMTMAVGRVGEGKRVWCSVGVILLRGKIGKETSSRMTTSVSRCPDPR